MAAVNTTASHMPSVAQVSPDPRFRYFFHLTPPTYMMSDGHLKLNKARMLAWSFSQIHVPWVLSHQRQWAHHPHILLRPQTQEAPWFFFSLCPNFNTPVNPERSLFIRDLEPNFLRWDNSHLFSNNRPSLLGLFPNSVIANSCLTNSLSFTLQPQWSWQSVI